MTSTIPIYRSDVYSRAAILDPYPSARVAAQLGPVELLPAERIGQRRVATALGELTTTEDVGSARQVAVIRPEQVTVAASDTLVSAPGTGRIDWASYRGDSQTLAVQVGAAGGGGAVLTVRTEPHRVWHAGDAVQLSVSGPVHLVPAP